MSATLINVDLTADQLKQYARLIYEKIGIFISPQKATLLSNRLRRRLRATGLDCYDRYLEKLKTLPAGDSEWEAFLQEVTTHETYLFRDQAHWDWLRNVFAAELLSAAKAGKRTAKVRVWSAACSTGDEAYTIACCLADRLTNWKIEILGTDVGNGAVAAAQKAVFSDRAMRLVSPTYRQRFFKKDEQGNWEAKPVLRDMMRFKTHNLMHSLNEPRFDLIVLKNVLIYFDTKSKQQVLNQIRRMLHPQGALVTGPAEGVSELLKDMRSLQGWLHRPAQ